MLRSASCIIEIERVGERGADKSWGRAVDVVMVVVITVSRSTSVLASKDLRLYRYWILAPSHKNRQVARMSRKVGRDSRNEDGTFAPLERLALCSA
jgi:hypothetical protein